MHAKLPPQWSMTENMRLLCCIICFTPLSADISFFNVFRYITFHSVWALLTALIISIVVGPYFIQLLKRIKFGQYIQDDVKIHWKRQAPHHGRLAHCVSLMVSVLLWADLTNPYIWLTMMVFAGFAVVGFG